MVATPTEAELRMKLVRATFDAAAEHFDDDPLFFWDHCGKRTVELAGVVAGHQVLDICCGTGASALPAAATVGPTGRVLGIDAAAGPLARARAKASRRGLTNVAFASGDMAAPRQPDNSYDVVICVLGIYFAVNIPAVLAGLWKIVRPGGTLAITTWGPRALEPANTMYFDAVAAQRPDLRPQVIPWERINEPAALSAAFAAAGIGQPIVVEETITHPMSAEEFWTVILGSGYRLLIDVMGDEAAGRVRSTLHHRMRSEGLHEVVSDLLYARATKDADPFPPLISPKGA